MTRVLLSSVSQPFGEKYGDGFGTSFEGTHQLMWAQGIFRPRGTTTQWGIDFIAHNLRTPTVTMHYPTLQQFQRELRRGYDYVGIAFIAPTLHKLIPMVEAAREIAPQTKIILGGYGAALDDHLLPEADHICRGEGVRFMRELLGEDVDAPIIQPVILQDTQLFSLPLGRTGYVFAGLGCPNGCDFCATSHFFKRKHIKFLPQGEAICEAIQELHDKDLGITTYWINDEDFLLNEKRGRGYLEAIRESQLPPVSLSIFSSVKALSQFEPSELVEMGIDWVWVGYEGKRAGYAKMNGSDYRTLFNSLHEHGITVSASMIIGFDYQTPEIIQEEFDELMDLRPSIGQYLIYGPTYGTPLHARMEAEGRMLPRTSCGFAKHDGFSLGFTHPHIEQQEMEDIQRGLYRQEFERLGPSVFRVVDDWITGHKNLSDHPSKRVCEKAKKYGDKAHGALMLLPTAKQFVNKPSAIRLGKLYQTIKQATGPMTLGERARAGVVPAAFGITAIKQRLGLGDQPSMTRKTWRC